MLGCQKLDILTHSMVMASGGSCCQWTTSGLVSNLLLCQFREEPRSRSVTKFAVRVSQPPTKVSIMIEQSPRIFNMVIKHHITSYWIIQAHVRCTYPYSILFFSLVWWVFQPLGKFHVSRCRTMRQRAQRLWSSWDHGYPGVSYSGGYVSYKWPIVLWLVIFPLKMVIFHCYMG